MADKRIIELANEKLLLSDGDMTIVDSENGTYKYDLNRLAKKTITDTTLSVEGKPADAKAVGDALASVELSEDLKTALLNCFAHVAWTDEHGQDYYDALEEALYPSQYET